MNNVEVFRQKINLLDNEIKYLEKKVKETRRLKTEYAEYLKKEELKSIRNKRIWSYNISYHNSPY